MAECMDCGKQTRNKRCWNCHKINIDIGIRNCEDCGSQLPKYSKSKVCRPCLNKRISANRKIWYCISCNQEIPRRHKRCKPCDTESRKGKPSYIRTPEHREKLSKALRGKPKPWMRGELHHNYKGGNSPQRQLDYVSAEGKAFLRTVYERDAYTCQECGNGKTEDKGLHAHHLKNWAEYPNLRFEIDNAITLCRKCHIWVHSSQNIESEYLE